MRGFLLDTNVLSELRRPRPEHSVIDFVSARAEDELFTSDVTFAELRFGIESLRDQARQAEMTAWVESELRPLFAGRVLTLNEDVILRWRSMLETGRQRGHTFDHIDLFIAAMAARAEMVVVTRDTAHYVAAGVAVLSPWTSVFTNGSGSARTLDDLSRPYLLKELA